MFKKLLLVAATSMLLGACATAAMPTASAMPCCAECKTCKEACCCKGGQCPMTQNKSAGKHNCCCACCNK